jgi:hypothetical protein
MKLCWHCIIVTTFVAAKEYCLRSYSLGYCTASLLSVMTVNPVPGTSCATRQIDGDSNCCSAFIASWVGLLPKGCSSMCSVMNMRQCAGTEWQQQLHRKL